MGYHGNQPEFEEIHLFSLFSTTARGVANRSRDRVISFSSRPIGCWNGGGIFARKGIFFVPFSTSLIPASYRLRSANIFTVNVPPNSFSITSASVCPTRKEIRVPTLPKTAWRTGNES